MIYGEAVSPKTVEPRVNPFTRQWTWILLAAAITSLVVKFLLAWNTFLFPLDKNHSEPT
jgi:hypothetical protein